MKTSDKFFIVFLVVVIGLNMMSYVDQKNKVDEQIKVWQEMADLNQEGYEEIVRSLAEIKYSLNKLQGK